MYTKIFKQIYEGTLATMEAPEAITVFMHLLVMGYPDGVVDVPPGIIAQRSRLPLEYVEAGLRALEQPDPRSRTPDHDGRRIIRLDDHRDWGWKIVNFVHYRNLQNEQAKREYNRSWMKESRRAGESNHSSPHQSTVDQCGDSKSKSKSKRKPKPLGRADARPGGFDIFWAAYPRKVKRVNALKAWAKLKPDDQLLTTILKAVERCSASEQWTRDGKRFIPHPATWLNAKQWEDEVPHKIFLLPGQVAGDYEGELACFGQQVWKDGRWQSTGVVPL